MHQSNYSVAGLGTANPDDRIDLIVAGPRHDFPDCTIRAIQAEIGDLGILRVESLEELLASGQDIANAQLLLLHERLCLECLAAHERLIAAMPSASVAIACTSTDNESTLIRKLLCCELVRGILPFNLKLDIWLSALRLLLSGGDYFPLELVHLLPLSGKRDRAKEPAVATADRRTSLAGCVLTDRETDVLGLVAQGLQNKNIASRLALSEHTVKLHIHHIISKLGVHNRTEAAAVYLNGIDN